MDRYDRLLQKPNDLSHHDHEGLLASALARPQSFLAYAQPAPPDLAALPAAYAYGEPLFTPELLTRGPVQMYNLPYGR